MKRFTLAGQVALIVALAIFCAQMFNLALAVDHRRDLALKDTIAPAAQRLAFAAENPGYFDRRDERREARRDRRGLGREGPPRRGGRFLRPRLVESQALPDIERRMPRLEQLTGARLAEAGVSGDIRIGRIAGTPDRDGRSTLLFALELEDGRWAVVRAPGPPSVRPLVAMLTLQSLLIGLAILLPTLWLLRRVGGSLTRLKTAARDFDGAAPSDPVPVTGPKDVASLIEAVNAMQARIATMLAEKDVMLGAIGHDLRTPLTALRIEAEAVEDEERREALVAQVERLHGQFEAILELARSARPIAPGQVVDVASLLDRLSETYRGRPVAIHRDGHASFPGDPVAVERALANLVDNGLRHGSRVDVHTRLDDAGITFVVEDDGPGIPASDRERMMRPFERGEGSRNRETGGHGLGLAIVAAILRRHRGSLTLSSRADGTPGLAASLAFPLLSGSAQTLH